MFGLKWTSRYTPIQARAKILARNFGSRVKVLGDLDLSGESNLRYLPTWFECNGIDLSRCVNLEQMPFEMRATWIRMRETGVRVLPRLLSVSNFLDASHSPRIKTIPPIQVPILQLAGCRELTCIEQGTTARTVDLTDCVKLKSLPDSLVATVENLNLTGCVFMEELSGDFRSLKTLCLNGCTAIRELSSDLQVKEWIDVAGTGIEELPYSMRSTRVLWRGIEVPDHVAFYPEIITVDEIINERNSTTRTILLERMGLPRFLKESKAKIIDQDVDRGGTRVLYHVNSVGADIAMLAVTCPSTQKNYLMRVPPSFHKAQEAAAWMAGVPAEKYHPEIET